MDDIDNIEQYDENDDGGQSEAHFLDIIAEDLEHDQIEDADERYD
eukprot:CAMPEP_0116871546 /NCGR_PEP_ID=MMETSP0463-20121206/1943_1 /TAXON_ID=181622 /ORGANISM="Strombidinopsis sp, Strain SopsisLIS2011" /LENGTH=44 /DNA_ID= /DNA_START= /DNA_END= /DNA_ORIENTATION=